MPKLVKYYTEEEYKGFLWCSKVINYGVSLTVFSAINEIHAARSVLLDYPHLYKFDVKRHCNEAFKEATRHEQLIKKYVLGKDFWEDYSDKVIDEAENDIMLFRIAIKQELDKSNLPNTTLLSYTECARILAYVAVIQYDDIMKDAREKFHFDYTKYFLEYRIEKLYCCWQKMCDALYKGKIVNLGTDAIQSAFNVLYNKFTDGGYVDACLNEALDKHPEFMKQPLQKT